MERMGSMGYFIVTGLDISRKSKDKALLLFRKGSPVSSRFMCLSLHENDEIRFINAPQNIVDVSFCFSVVEDLH